MVRRAALATIERGARRPGADQWLSRRDPGDALVGLGRARSTRRRCPRTRWASCAETRRARGAPAPARWRSDRCALRAAGRCRDGARGAARDRRRRARARRPRRTRAARRRQGLSRSRAPARGRARGRARRGRAIPRGHEQLRARARAVRAQLACGRAVRGRHERRRRRGAAARRARRRDRAGHGRAWADVLALDRAVGARSRVQAGMRAPALERHLAARGLTLGHFPQSFEYVSLGGCAATRSAGQASTGYGAIDKMVLGLRLAAPAGEIELPAVPASAAGPGLRQLLVGSEGTLGVISELALRVRQRAGASASTRACSSRTSPPACEALRALAQRARAAGRGAPVRRARDAHVAGAGGHAAALKGRLGRAYLGVRGYRGRLPGDPRLRGRSARTSASGASARSRWCARAAGSRSGARPGEAWLHGRFAAPYLRDELLTHGVMVETLETAAQWSNVPRAARARSREAIGAGAARVRHAWPGHVPRLARLRDRRLAVLHVPRAASARAMRSSSGARSRTPPSEAIVAERRHDHPPPRRRARPRALGCPRRSARVGSRRCARSRPSSIPRGS